MRATGPSAWELDIGEKDDIRVELAEHGTGAVLGVVEVADFQELPKGYPLWESFRGRVAKAAKEPGVAIP